MLEQQTIGRSMMPGKWNRSIHLFLLAAKGVSGPERSSGDNFCRSSSIGNYQSGEHVVAVMKVSGIRIQIYEGADGVTFQAVLRQQSHADTV